MLPQESWPNSFVGTRTYLLLRMWTGLKELKRQEKGRDSVTEGIPSSLPALLFANKVLSRSAHIGAIPQQHLKAESALAEVRDEEAFGDFLLALVFAGRAHGWDSEMALRAANHRFVDDVKAIELNVNTP
jgi:XTP/dITP diphosphohydrolase